MKRDMGTCGPLPGSAEGGRSYVKSIGKADPGRCFIGKYDIIALEKGSGPCVYLN